MMARVCGLCGSTRDGRVRVLQDFGQGGGYGMIGLPNRLFSIPPYPPSDLAGGGEGIPPYPPWHLAVNSHLINLINLDYMYMCVLYRIPCRAHVLE